MNPKRLPLVLSILLLIVSISTAEIPQVISYQGKVTDSAGSPVADGTYNMRFRIYNVPTGGSELWNSGLQPVAVSGGVFNVLLGESPMPSLNLPFDEDYWLFVTFDGINQTPRQRIGAAGYAYMASGLVAGTEVVGSVTNGSASAIKGSNMATSGTTYGGIFESSSNYGAGVFGYATATSGSTNGVYGSNRTTSGGGVLGLASSTTGENYGVYGASVSPEGKGVCGYALATTGYCYGIYGGTISTSGIGVGGVATTSTGINTGVYGKSSSISGRGVYGIAISTTGITYGVAGQTNSVNGRAVYGHAVSSTGECYGGRFENGSTSGRGIFGHAYSGTGTTYGVWGLSSSTSGRGVYGLADATSGTNYGVYGETASTDYGFGVYGRAYATIGQVYGVAGYSSSINGIGVYGQDYESGYGVYYAGGLAGSGTKSCVVKTSQGPSLMYCQESPENWFEDIGGGRLVNGQAHVELDPLFLETVTIDKTHPMRVFVQLHDRNCNGVAVEKGLTGFDVVELKSGLSNGSFDYRVVAKRKGFESKRLDYCKAAETDAYLYPELREKELRELEAMRAGNVED